MLGLDVVNVHQAKMWNHQLLETELFFFFSSFWATAEHMKTTSKNWLIM